MYRIQTMTCTNFGPFESASFDFDEPGLTVLEGVFDDGHARADSNGSGKSMLIEAVCWCLFGQCLRINYSSDELVRLEGDEGACVEVKVKADNDEVVVTRYRKHSEHKHKVYLRVNGKDRTAGTIPETDKEITRAIGLDFMGFVNSVAFGARVDVNGFFAASDTDRKAILETILGLGLYGEAQTVAKVRAQDAANKMADMTRSIEAKEAKVESKSESINRLKEAGNVDDLDEHIAESKLRMVLLRKKHATLEKREASLKQEVAKERIAHGNAKQQYDAAKKSYDSERNELTDKADDAKKDMIQNGAKADAAKKRLDALAKTEGLETCPTCQQKVPKSKWASIRAEIEAEIKEATHAAEGASMQRIHYTDLADKLTVPVEPDRDALDEAEDEYETVQNDVKASATEIKHAEKMLGELQGQKGRYEGQMAALERERADTLSEIEAKRDELTAVEEEYEMIRFWVEGFGNRGLKSFLIEAEVPAINRAATKYARRLIGPGAKVVLHATTTLKSKKDTVREKLSIEGVIPGCTNTYAGASKGQKRRMDLALILAFRDTVASRAGQKYDQLFADELFDGMDKTGAAVVADLLGELSKKSPILLVTHDERLKDVGNRLTTVLHNGESARIMTGGSEKVRTMRKRATLVKRK